MKAGRRVLNFVGGLSDRVMTRIPSLMLEPNPLTRERYHERLRYYAEWPEGQPFFVEPSEPAMLTQIEQAERVGVARVTFRYPSRFRGVQPGLRADLARYPANHTGYLHLWRHDASTHRPLVLCVHGFGMSGPSRAQTMFKIERLCALGLDVALHHLPHHWRRSDSPPNNQMLRPQDVPLTIEEWARNLHDLQAAILALRGLGYARIGLIGASLGGLTLALLATTAAEADFLFLVVPAVDLRDYLEPRAERMAFSPDDETRALTLRALARITPASYAPRFPVARIAAVAHEGDRICPIGYTRELVRAWQITEYTEVIGGHWVYLDHSVRGRTWYGWLERMGYLGA